MSQSSLCAADTIKYDELGLRNRAGKRTIHLLEERNSSARDFGGYLTENESDDLYKLFGEPGSEFAIESAKDKE